MTATTPSSREPTRRRVLRAVRELRYHPNLRARSLAGALQEGLQVVVKHTDYRPVALEPKGCEILEAAIVLLGA